MGLNGTKNIDKFKSCSDELRLAFTSTCKALCGRKWANSFSSFCHLSFIRLQQTTFCIRMFGLCPEGTGQDNGTLSCYLGAMELPLCIRAPLD